MTDRMRTRMRAHLLPSLAGAAALLAACGALSACSQNPTMTRGELLNQQEYAQYRLPGTSVIEGQVMLELPTGEKIYGGNCQVRLMPVTSSTIYYVQNVVLPGGMKPPKQTLQDVSWIAQADALGRFRFSELPAGHYYVTCPMAWLQNGVAREGIALGETRVAAGETVQVTVTRGTGTP
jgi:hypothetical protein